jgi:SAM-dependent methyltransferase
MPVTSRDRSVLAPPGPAFGMSPALDELSIKFAAYTRCAGGEALDIGCGNGIATAAAIARGGRVLAVDPDENCLNDLRARVPAERRARLRTQRGELPTLDFNAAHFAAIHVARVLHLLPPADVQKSLRKFFRWLYPNGKLFVSALSHAGQYWRFADSDIAQRRADHNPWPGYMKGLYRLRNGGVCGADSILLLDEPVLRRELILAGFFIEETKSYALPWDSEQSCCALVARCSA